MKMQNMNRGLETLLPQSRKWLLERGYIKANDDVKDEYELTEEGYLWINQLMQKPKANTR